MNTQLLLTESLFLIGFLATCLLLERFRRFALQRVLIPVPIKSASRRQ